MYSINIPLRVVSEANTHEHWRKSWIRHKLQKATIKFTLMSQKAPKTLPVQITLTRHGKGTLDGDNLISAFKYVRDAVSEYLIEGKLAGRADDDPRITWGYAQEKSKEYFITIQFQS